MISSFHGVFDTTFVITYTLWKTEDHHRRCRIFSSVEQGWENTESLLASNIGISDLVQGTVLGVFTQQMELKPDLALNRI